MKYLVTFILIIYYFNAFAQNPNDAIIVSSGGGVRSMDIQSKPKETKGSFYYNENWQKGSIKLFSGEEINDYLLKYDMKMNRIDIKTKSNSVKIISIGAVKEITWLKDNGTVETLRNTSLYKNSNQIGFFSVLDSGRLTLLKKTNLKLLESNYNGVVVAGSESKRYIKKETYYIYTGEKINPIKRNKRKILAKFDDKIDLVKKYAEENELNFKDDYNLSQIFNYYNSL